MTKVKNTQNSLIISIIFFTMHLCGQELEGNGRNHRRIFNSYNIKNKISSSNQGYYFYSDSIKDNSPSTNYNFYLRNYSKTGYVPFQELAVQLFHKTDNIQLLIEPIIVSSHRGFDLLNTKYERRGFSGSFKNAFISLANQKKNISILFGRSFFFWGQSINSSIVKGLDSGPMDIISLNIKSNDFRYEILNSQLGSIIDDKENTYNRYFVGKRLIYNKSEKFYVELGELFIYSGVNRPAELKFINPFIPSFLLDINNSSFEKNDNYNSIIFADFRYNINNNVSFIGEFIVDDLQIDETGRDNKLGYKLGVNHKKELKYGFSYEFTHINPTTYLHTGDFTSYHNFEKPIGYKYGPNSESNDFIFNYNINKTLNVNIQMTYLKKGSNFIIKNDFKLVENNNVSSYKILRFYNFGIKTSINKFYVSLEYSNVPYINQEVSGFLDTEANYGIVLDVVYIYK